MLNAEPDPDVEKYVELTVLCKEFGTLPRAGGLNDQDYNVMQAMLMVRQAQEERAELEQRKAQGSSGKRPVARRR